MLDAVFEEVKEIYFQYRLWKYVTEQPEETRVDPVKIVCSVAMIPKNNDS